MRRRAVSMTAVMILMATMAIFFSACGGDDLPCPTCKKPDQVECSSPDAGPSPDNTDDLLALGGCKSEYNRLQGIFKQACKDFGGEGDNKAVPLLNEICRGTRVTDSKLSTLAICQDAVKDLGNKKVDVCKKAGELYPKMYDGTKVCQVMDLLDCQAECLTSIQCRYRLNDVKITTKKICQAIQEAMKGSPDQELKSKLNDMSNRICSSVAGSECYQLAHAKKQRQVVCEMIDAVVKKGKAPTKVLDAMRLAIMYCPMDKTKHPDPVDPRQAEGKVSVLWSFTTDKERFYELFVIDDRTWKLHTQTFLKLEWSRPVKKDLPSDEKVEVLIRVYKKGEHPDGDEDGSFYQSYAPTKVMSGNDGTARITIADIAKEKGISPEELLKNHGIKVVLSFYTTSEAYKKGESTVLKAALKIE